MKKLLSRKQFFVGKGKRRGKRRVKEGRGNLPVVDA